ncbi:MAG: hypothetical protein MJ252_22810 [archaeon]|nr:hypothetical protein [archaeon]
MKIFFIFLIYLISFILTENNIPKQVKAFCTCLRCGKTYIRNPEQIKNISDIQKELWTNPEITKKMVDIKIKKIRGIKQVESCYKKYIATDKYVNI